MRDGREHRGGARGVQAGQYPQEQIPIDVADCDDTGIGIGEQLVQ